MIRSFVKSFLTDKTNNDDPHLPTSLPSDVRSKYMRSASVPFTLFVIFVITRQGCTQLTRIWNSTSLNVANSHDCFLASHFWRCLIALTNSLYGCRGVPICERVVSNVNQWLGDASCSYIPLLPQQCNHESYPDIAKPNKIARGSGRPQEAYPGPRGKWLISIYPKESIERGNSVGETAASFAHSTSQGLKRVGQTESSSWSERCAQP